MILNLQQFIEACMKFPLKCGWSSGEVNVSTDDFDSEVEVFTTIHKNLLEKFDNLSDIFDYVREEAKTVFGENLTNVTINETGGENATYEPYYVTLRFRYKEPTENET